MLTATADKLSRFIERLDVVSRPYLYGLLLTLCLSLIILISSIVRFGYLYPETTTTYLLQLYLGGAIAFYLVALFKSGVLFIITRSSNRAVKFGSFLFGIIMFSFPQVLQSLFNIFYPIIHAENGYAYNVVSLASFMDIREMNVFVGTFLSMIDLFVLIQIVSYVAYIHTRMQIKILYSAILIIGIEYAFLLLSLFYKRV